MKISPNSTKLHLPLPEKLEASSEAGGDIVAKSGNYSDIFLEKYIDHLKLSEWLSANGNSIDQLSAISSEQAHYTNKHSVYDNFFNVARHTGSKATISHGLCHVLKELSEEFQLGSELDIDHKDNLYDGLAAVLETIYE